MKKIFALCCLAVCLLLAGCEKPGEPGKPVNPNPTEAVLKPGFDAQNKYILMNNHNFYETDEFFCGSTTDYAYYYDKASGLSGVLCADPACTHDSEDCGAYVNRLGSVTCYDGKRYWVAQNGQSFTLCRSDLAGTNREVLKTLDWNKIILTYQPQRFVIHRGRLYILGQANSVEGTGAGIRMTLLSMSLDGSEEFTVLYDKTFEDGAWITARFVGDNVYYCVREGKRGSRNLTIQKIDTKDGSTEIVYEEAGISEFMDDIWVTNQGEIYLPGSDSDRAYVWKLENGKRTEVVSWEGPDFYGPKIVDGIAFVTSEKDDVNWIDIADLSGNAIYSGKLLPEEIPGVAGDPNKYSLAMIGGDREKIIVNIEGRDYDAEKRPSHVILLDLRNNLKPTVLWSSEG